MESLLGQKKIGKKKFVYIKIIFLSQNSEQPKQFDVCTTTMLIISYSNAELVTHVGKKLGLFGGN